MPNIPTAPNAKACFDGVQERAPLLWTALQERLLPAAADDARPAGERIREVRRLGAEAWTAFLDADDEGQSFALGQSWPCCVEDVAAAVAFAAAERGDQAELEDVLAALEEAPPGQLSTSRAIMDVQAQLGPE